MTRIGRLVHLYSAAKEFPGKLTKDSKSANP